MADDKEIIEVLQSAQADDDVLPRPAGGAMACLWCDREFHPRNSGGSVQKFCSKDCRLEFHAAARAWAEQAVGSGRLPVSAFKVALQQRARCVQSR